jgi:arylsulfatase A-like enzyme
MPIRRDYAATHPTHRRTESGWIHLIGVAAVVIIAGVFLSACSAPEERSDAPRLVILYATCSLNKDFLSPYNSKVTYTPHLQRFARRAVVFKRHQTEAGQSGIAFASIFSGTQATEHGVFAHPTQLADEKLLVAETFAAAGYETFSWLGHQMASARLNYAQGVPTENVYAGKLMAKSPHFLRILKRLQSDPSYKAFIVTNFSVTHAPYGSHFQNDFCARYPTDCRQYGEPEDFERNRTLLRRHSRGLARDYDKTIKDLGLDHNEIARLVDVAEILYKSDVNLLDRLFGEVLAAISQFHMGKQSAIAFTSDHGEIHYRENAYFRWTHGYQLAPEVLGVPLLIRAPGLVTKKKTYAGVTRSIDVFPTLAGLAHLPSAGGSGRGVDLSRVLTQREAPPRLLAFSHTAMFHQAQWQRRRRLGQLASLFPQPIPDFMWVAVRDRDMFFKLRRLEGTDWRVSAFDLRADPGELHDLYDPSQATHVAMSEQLHAYKRRLVAAAADFGDNVPDSRAVELLRSLGYID